MSDVSDFRSAIPRPWHVSHTNPGWIYAGDRNGDGMPVASCDAFARTRGEGDAIAEFIVEAVNTVDGLHVQIETMEKVAKTRERQFGECKATRDDLIHALREIIAATQSSVDAETAADRASEIAHQALKQARADLS